MAHGDVTSLRNLALAVSPMDSLRSRGWMGGRWMSCTVADAVVFTKGNQATDYVCKEGYLNQIPGAAREIERCW